jgi:hypothetical protein
LVASLLQATAPPRSTTPTLVAGATSQSDALLLLDPGIGQGLGEAGDGKIRRCSAIDDGRNDAGRQESEGSEQANVPFALGLTLGYLGEGANAAKPDVVDPSPGLGIAARRVSAFIVGFTQGARSTLSGDIHGLSTRRPAEDNFVSKSVSKSLTQLPLRFLHSSDRSLTLALGSDRWKNKRFLYKKNLIFNGF